MPILSDDERASSASARLGPSSEWHLTRWSRRRRVLSAGVLAIVLAGAGWFAWRATRDPLELWIDARQCAGAPGPSTGRLFGLAVSSELRGVSDLTILEIDTTAWSGAAAPRYWVVPVARGTDGTGGSTVDDPPDHWNGRTPAVGATLRAAAPASLIVELRPRNGHALLRGLRVTYRTPDGFVHTAEGDPGLEVDTTGQCRASTGP